MRELPRQLTVDELAELFEGRTRFVERLAALDDPLGRARGVAAELTDEVPRSIPPFTPLRSARLTPLA